VPNVNKTTKSNGKMLGGITGKGFKPGVSGNPNGRPKGIQSIPDILRKIGEEDGTVDGKSKLDVIMYMVFSFALEGKPWAVQFIADRTEGRALERVEQHVTKDEIIIE
tara:strand:+ start:82 stop:405 length:324 start_codon:yes stop_codon:yes gene_type:complete